MSIRGYFLLGNTKRKRYLEDMESRLSPNYEQRINEWGEGKGFGYSIKEIR